MPCIDRSVRLRLMLIPALCLAAGGVQADVQKDRAEVRKMCDEALATLYKSKPQEKAKIARSPGYGCFSSFGITFLVGGAGGKGLVHDNTTRTDTYMNMGQMSAGIEVGIKDYREVLVFKDHATLKSFVDSGWELTGSGGASADAKDKGGTAEKGASVTAKIEIFPMTKTGLSAGGSVGGRKYWKDEALNAK
ncbi:YSC84-related protein [Uliginosibacterium sp. H3]|uniref:YSC84-related protein n=1 Tax=Uliginosibacterium silvisoli TaxID=3114758 RepID=A0ABU6K166_9RHOO|nr:YSC84-related protein [Uliginosibacterium sp. H3]